MMKRLCPPSIKGNIVTIYQKPFTEEDPEGKATLKNKIREDETFETWKVHFQGDDPSEVFERKILRGAAGERL